MIHSVDYLYGNKNSKRFNNHNILGKSHPNSLSGYIKLKHFYLCQDEKRRSRTKNDWRDWLRFRNRFLKRMKKENGKLTCYVCTKINLHPNHNSPNAKKGFKATIDHYLPLSKGGKKYSDSNLFVCCEVCNGKKADIIPEEFFKEVA